MKYSCYATVIGSKYLGEVEADSPEEAQEKALNLDTCNISLCHQCCRDCEDAYVDEITAEPA